MAAFTEEQYDALMAAIASGSSTLSYGGKNIAFRSMDEMLRLARLMQRSLGKGRLSYSTRLKYKSPLSL